MTAMKQTACSKSYERLLDKCGAIRDCCL